MKTTSLILSLLFSDMKREDIYLELVFVMLFLKVGWLTLTVFLKHAANLVTYPHDRNQGQLAGCFSLCN
jgi:hypothetical protein